MNALLSFFNIKDNISDILIMYYNNGQQILQERANFRGISKIDVQTGSDQVLKTGSALILSNGSGSDLFLKTGADHNFGIRADPDA